MKYIMLFNKIFSPIRMSILAYIFLVAEILVGAPQTWAIFILCASPVLYIGNNLYHGNILRYLDHQMYLLKNDWHNREYLYK